MKPETKDAIRTWYNTITQAGEAMDSLDKAVGYCPESPVAEAVANVVTEYTRAVQGAHGLGTWLEWYWLECDMGKNPLLAASGGNPLREIATVEDLIKLCETYVEQP